MVHQGHLCPMSERVHGILIKYDSKGACASLLRSDGDKYRKSEEVGQQEGKVKHGRLAGIT
jgi:hypothetical protein